MKESGYPDFVTATWNGVLAPKGTAPAVQKKLQDAVLKVAGSADFKTRVGALGGEVRLMDTNAFRSFAHAEYQHWGTIIKNAGVTVQ
jgi:tripartite-type tricarboxylate transporter receptor subunit TctC